MEVIKEILFEMRSEHISAIRETIESEYQLREHLGEWSDNVLSEAKLEIKKLSYQGSKTDTFPQLPTTAGMSRHYGCPQPTLESLL